MLTEDFCALALFLVLENWQLAKQSPNALGKDIKAIKEI